jgi:hypothetical protein
MVAVLTTDRPSNLQKGARNNSVPSRHTSSITDPRPFSRSNGRIDKRRYIVGSIQLPSVTDKSSCWSQNARSSAINCTMSSNIEIQSSCIGSCCFHIIAIGLCGRGEFGGDLQPFFHRAGRGKMGGTSCEKLPIRSALPVV